MAKKPHRFADNRVEIATLLGEADLRAICARAAVESTGDLWNGVQRVVETGSGDGVTVYLVKDALTGWSKLMTFVVEFGSANHKTTLATSITTYMTTRPTAYGIPTGPNRMTAHHTYVQFMTKVANTVRLADATANVTLIDGSASQPPPPPAPAKAPRSAAPSAPWAVAPAAAQPAAAQPAAPAPQFAPPAPPAGAPPQVAPPQFAPPSAPALPGPPAPVIGVGVPPAPPAAPFAPPAPPAPSAPPMPLDEATQIVTRTPRAKPTWFLRPDDLARVQVSAPVSLGRDPRGSGAAGETLLAVPPTEWTVSKTHARLHVADGVLYVTDLDSTNGTFLIDEHEDMVQCEPNVATVVPFGSGLELGAYAVAVDREAGVRA